MIHWDRVTPAESVAGSEEFGLGSQHVRILGRTKLVKSDVGIKRWLNRGGYFESSV